MEAFPGKLDQKAFQYLLVFLPSGFSKYVEIMEFKTSPFITKGDGYVNKPKREVSEFFVTFFKIGPVMNLSLS